MLYICCPTCRTLLGNKQIYYERNLAELCKKFDMGEYKTKSDFDNDKIKLVNSIGLENYCCRMRLITYVKLIEIIK